MQSSIDPIGDSERPRPCVWAIGGGKGGVGKSVITSSLGIAMARQGERCVLVDADLGGANLHTLLGVQRPRRTLAHFLNNEVRSLSEVLCPGPVPNLWLISGADAPLEMANPRYSRKEKLLSAIRRLDVDHVFLDLSAGSAFNVLDFFLAAPRGILVVVPEPTSIENAYHFLRAAFLRALRRAVKQPRVRETINRALEERGGRRCRTPRELLSRIMELDPQTGTILQNHADAFTPMLVVNQVRAIEQRRIGLDISLAAREYLGTEIEYIGALAHDECVCTAVGQHTPVVQRFPAASFSRDLKTIVERLQTKKRLTPRGIHGSATSTVRRARSLCDRDEALATCGLLIDPQVSGTARVEPAHPSGLHRQSCQVEQAPQPEVGVTTRPPLPPFGADEPGAYLRRCREHLGLSLADLERKTRIRCFRAIEEEDFSRMPPEPLIRSTVVTYGRALGVAEPRRVAARFVARFRLRACA